MPRIRLIPVALILMMFAAIQALAALPPQGANQSSAAAAPPAAPFPAQIASGKRVFIANHQAKSPLSEMYSGGPDHPYDSLYAAIKSWGRYELVFAPDAADLVFEIRLTNERLINGHQGYDQLRLKIIDPKTGIALWTLYQKIDPALRQATRDKNFDQAMQLMVNQVAALAGAAPAFPAVAKKAGGG